MTTLTLLIVDEEPCMRTSIKKILDNYTVTFPFSNEKFDFKIYTAENGQQCIDLLKKQKIDLILLDNKLPDIEGIEILTELNRRDYDAAVTMITAYASIDLAVRATEQGAYDFLPKPFNLNTQLMTWLNIGILNI